MLKLRKIYILGFKSFCDRTELTVPGAGIAVIAGPNGCGKSNILDGLSWVLGEQRAKSMRSTQMQDVIFSGTHDRKPLGMAEVTLILVDPEIYNGPVSSEPEFTVDFNDPPDWDEEEIRRQHEAEAEEIAAAKQPDHVIEEDGPIPPASAFEGPALLKTRRRTFQPTPVKGETIITRRLFRTGESEYLLNGKLCRLRDVQEIFMSTGLGPDTYAIIGQEQIGQLLSSKPNDRRAVIEEAAGISGFNAKKRLAEQRLESARQNLARVDDIFEEVTHQMGSLKRQAAKAERFASVHEELRARLRVALASRMALMDADHARLNSEVGVLTEKINAASVMIETMEARQHSLTEGGYELNREEQRAKKQANAAEIELERVVAKERNNSERVKELEERLVFAATELEQIGNELSASVQEREQQSVLLDTANEEVCSCRQKVEIRQQEVRAASDEIFSTERQSEVRRHHVLQLLVLAGDARNSTIQAEETLAMLESEAGRLESEIKDARKDFDDLRAEKDRATRQFESTNETLKQTIRHLAALGENLQAHRAEEIAVRARANQLRAEQAATLGRRYSLEVLIRDHGYATDTVQELLRLDALGAGIAPVGTLADFLEVHGGHEDVVDEFLRNELNYIVVDSWSSAEEGVRLLKARVKGCATFLVHPSPIEEDSTVENQSAIRKPGLTPLMDEIRVLNGFGQSLETILPKLKNGYIVENSVDAQRLAVEFTNAFFLTPEGECFHNLTVTGGKPVSEGPLASKHEQQVIEARLTEIERKLTDDETKEAALAVTIGELFAELEVRSEERRKVETDLLNQAAVLKQMESEVLRIDRRLQDRAAQASRNTETRAAKRAIIEEKSEEARRLEMERNAGEMILEEQQIKLAELRHKRETLQQEAAEAAAELAGLEERLRSTRSALQRTDFLRANLQRRVLTIEEQRTAAEAAREQCLRENAELADQSHGLTALHAKAMAEAETVKTQVLDMHKQLSELETELRTERATLDRLRDERAQHSNETAKIRADLDHCEANCFTEVNEEAQVLRVDTEIVHISDEELAAEEEKCRILRHELEQMGQVNMMALDEYKETVGRHEFLEAQRRDLIESIENTQEVIREIEQFSRTKFDEALARINENFHKVFGWLFYGGQALLRVIDSENEVESGLEIIASPPGKKLQNVLLLSGGEKALTALALLVAIFQYRPSPFCVLDEVDAPLDETNVGRFADLMRALSHDIQFLVVTHSKRMMQSADMIFGVTMQEPGVSKVVSLRLGDREHYRASA